MPANRSSDGPDLLRTWRRLSRWPGGRWLFSRLVGWIAPYSGTTGVRIRALEAGRSELLLRDRRRVRNHLDSIHAVALVNAGELASGLAMLTALPGGTRSIVVSLACEYEKKARGTISIVGEAEPPDEVTSPVESIARAVMRDAEGHPVARLQVTWRLAPSESGGGAASS